MLRVCRLIPWTPNPQNTPDYLNPNPTSRAASISAYCAAGKPLSGELLQAEVAGIILGGLDTTAQTCAFTLCASLHPGKLLS